MGSGDRKSAQGALQQQAGLAQTQTDMSRKLADQSMPWTTLAGNYYKDILKGGDTLTKAVAPQINAVTGQFALARQKAKEQPLGGSRDRALREMNLGEAGTKSNIYSGGVNDAVTRLGMMGETGTQNAMGGYGSAASNFSNIAQQYGQMAQGKAGSMGGLAGAGGGVAAAAIAA
jgi:hypothetical protein